jgi:hypothetical protein
LAHFSLASLAARTRLLARCDFALDEAERAGGAEDHLALGAEDLGVAAGARVGQIVLAHGLVQDIRVPKKQFCSLCCCCCLPSLPAIGDVFFATRALAENVTRQARRVGREKHAEAVAASDMSLLQTAELLGDVSESDAGNGAGAAVHDLAADGDVVQASCPLRAPPDPISHHLSTRGNSRHRRSSTTVELFLCLCTFVANYTKSFS